MIAIFFGGIGPEHLQRNSRDIFFLTLKKNCVVEIIFSVFLQEQKMYLCFLLFFALQDLGGAFVSVHKKALPYYYPLMTLGNAYKNPITKLELFGEPLVCYNNRNGSFIVHSDICPHQGASLSKGWVNTMGNLQCPYHGFEFCSGMFCKIPNPIMEPPAFISNTKLPVFPTLPLHGMLFMAPLSLASPPLPLPFFPPEETDLSFRAIQGSRLIHKNHMTVCENLLDMLHISYVHSFGNSISPLPYSMKYRNLSESSGRAEFLYQPRDFTISSKVGRVSKVVVQNEYHLPTDTVTRVIAGNIIKTVFTRSLPVSKHKTLLFWKVYRNFWVDPYVPEFSVGGDYLLKYLMEKTIEEDVQMLQNVYSEHREGPLQTKYDVTIRNFRKSVTHALHSSVQPPTNATETFLQAFHDYNI